MKDRLNLRKILSMVLVLAVVFGAFVSSLSTQAETQVTKKQETVDIAVVYDNSGSMFNPGITYWCQAKYAVEIFASMLDYGNGDRLTIYPMHQVTTTGDASGSRVSEFSVTGLQDLDLITNMYTLSAGGTPFTPVETAYNDLRNSTLDQKWLIILTDGVFTSGLPKSNLEESLAIYVGHGINIQYLGFGSASALAGDPSRGFYADSSSGSDLKGDLTNICNRIFNRVELPKNRLKGSTLTLDLSMKKLIVFIQGKDAKVTSLTGPSGTVSVLQNSGQRKSVKIGAGNYSNPTFDADLAGQVITFDSCASGTYTLEYSGASANDIQIFYEPDVSVQALFTDKEGNQIDPSAGPITAGEYKLSYTIIDNVTGKEVLYSDLLGTVKMEATFTDPDGKDLKITNGEFIQLDREGEYSLTIKGSYLDDYEFTSSELGGIGKITIIPLPEELKLVAAHEPDWFQLSDNANWQPIRVAFTLGGEPLSDEELAEAAANLSISGGKDIRFRVELLNGQSAVNVYVGQDDQGNYVEPSTGIYWIDFETSLTDEYSRTLGPAGDRMQFEVSILSEVIGKLIYWLIFLVLLAILIISLLWYYSRPVLPRKLDCDQWEYIVDGHASDIGGFDYSRKQGEMVFEAQLEDFSQRIYTTLKLKPVSRRWTPSKLRTFDVVDIETSGSETRIDLGTRSYLHSTEGWYNPAGSKSMSVSGGLNFYITAKSAILRGHVKR